MIFILNQINNKFKTPVALGKQLLILIICPLRSYRFYRPYHPLTSILGRLGQLDKLRFFGNFFLVFVLNRSCNK
jgi:hypothetical protein